MLGGGRGDVKAGSVMFTHEGVIVAHNPLTARTAPSILLLSGYVTA
jgi:hypothetical protein